MTNKELLNLFRSQKKYANFTIFLDNLEESVKNEEEELAPCYSCGKNGLPNCGMEHCVTRNKEKK